MARAKLLTERIAKPTFGSGINWANPISSRLCFATLFNEIKSLQTYNLVTLVRGPLSGPAPPTWVGGVAAGLKFNSGTNTNSYVNFGNEAGVVDLGRNTSNPASFAFRMYAAGGSGIASRNDNNTVSAGWAIGYNSATGYIEYLHESNSANMVVSWLCPGNTWVTVVISSDGSLTAANTKCWINGKAMPTNATTNGSGTPGSDSGQPLYIGRSNFTIAGVGISSFNGSMDWFYMWKRALTAYDAQELTRNPYAPILDSGDLLVHSFGKSTSGGGGGSPGTSPIVPFFIAP